MNSFLTINGGNNVSAVIDSNRNVVASMPLAIVLSSVQLFAHLKVNCTEKKYSFTCNVNFYILDTFADPLGYGGEFFGTPYDINADWFEKVSGGGGFIH